ncbi:MAG: glycosyltransferase family protein [bacterium]
MAKILYGVMGNTYGHIMRARAIVNQWKGHEFYFIGGGRVMETLKKEFPVLEVPVLRTVHRKQSVNVPAVIEQIFGRLWDIPRVCKRIARHIESWQPDLAVCDREFFLPFACRRTGLRCVSVDHSHVLINCRYPVPSSQRLSWSLAMANDLLLFNHTRENCIVSFFHPPLKKNAPAFLFPPVLRPEVTAIQPGHGEHVLVYQTSPTFKFLIDALRSLKRKVIVYGFRNELETQRNITFKPYNLNSILEDLAGCAYAVVNGGHNLISEALFFGKPVLCFPIANLFEQFLNAWHVRELGYGDFSLSTKPNAALFEQFEAKLDSFHIEGKNFDGTSQVVHYLQNRLPSA